MRKIDRLPVVMRPRTDHHPRRCNRCVLFLIFAARDLCARAKRLRFPGHFGSMHPEEVGPELRAVWHACRDFDRAHAAYCGWTVDDANWRADNETFSEEVLLMDEARMRDGPQPRAAAEDPPSDVAATRFRAFLLETVRIAESHAGRERVGETAHYLLELLGRRAAEAFEEHFGEVPE